MPLPIQFFLFLLIGWVSRRQQEVIEYLKAENLALREKLGGRRLRFTDAQRRRLARKAKPLGRKRLRELSPIVTPDTLLRWYRELVAQKYDRSARRGPGRPWIPGEIQKWILEMASDNPRWGYTRIQEPSQIWDTPSAETRSSESWRRTELIPPAGARRVGRPS